MRSASLAFILFLAALLGGELKRILDPSQAIPEASDVIEYIQERVKE